MKNRSKILLLFVLHVCLYNLPFNSYAQEYSKLNEVPEWVKNRVTPEEYELWKTMSEVYQIDYSFLKGHISGDRKPQMLDFLHRTVSKIKDGSYPVEKGTLFCVADEYKVDPLLKWEQSELECRKKSCVIYSNRDGYDAHFKLTIIYGYDKEKNKVYPIKSETEGFSFSGVEVINNGDIPIIRYHEIDGKMHGTCCGTLIFKDGKGIIHLDNFTKYFILIP